VLLPNGWKVEVKTRRDGCAKLHGWLATADVLARKADRRPWLAVLPLTRLLDLLRAPRDCAPGAGTRQQGVQPAPKSQ
jgi:hypothetical protein